MSNAKRHFRKIGNPSLAALLAGVILLLDAMAACPALHEMIHHDADEHDHHCAVTMLAQGKVDTATVDVPIINYSILPVETVSLAEIIVFSATIENLPPSRAPPVSCSIS
jgi:hypothetical protein